MKQFAVIGNPIGHSLSPYLHNFVYNSLGIDAVYERKQVLKSELPQIINLIKNGDLSGINVTIPHKENIMEYLDNINPRAQSIGAVNIIMNNGNKLIGNNTDWFGFLMALKKNRIDPANKEVIVLGAGGTAKAILFALKQSGVNKIVLLNRTLQKAEESAQSPIDLGLIHENQTLIDVIYSPFETAFLKLGKKIGAKTLNGLDMFIYQGLTSIDLWFGKDISNQVNFTQLKTYLESKLC